MNNSNNFGNILLVIILVLLVGFGVWYFTERKEPAPKEGGIELNIHPPADSGAQGGAE